MAGTQQLVPDGWEQLYNPDRYIGNEYVSSFDLRLQTNADGSLTATAQYPGRYKIAAVLAGLQYTAVVVVPPAQPPVTMKGISFTMDGNVNRTYAPSVIALASHIGADWAQVQANVCMDLDTPGVYQYTDQPSNWCPYATPFADLGWVIDEFHSQGFKVMVMPAAYGYYQGVFDELELFLPGANSSDPKIPSAQVLNLFQGWAQMALAMATVAAQHQADMFVPGSHDIGFTQFDSTTQNALNADWVTLIQNIRAAYTGQLWWGPVDPCSISFPFTNYSLVDGIWFAGLTITASTPPCTYPSPPGINNIHAEQMLSYVRAWRSAGSGFSVGQKQGLPMFWTDLDLAPIDGMNYLQGHFGSSGTNGVQSYANSSSGRDYQEPADFLDAVMQAGVFEGSFQGVFPEAISLNGPYFTDITSQGPVLGSLTNWYGGDLSYFAPCMASLPPEVMFQLLPACPAALQMAGMSLNSLSMINDSASAVNPYFEGTTSASAQFGNPSWTDYELSLAVRFDTNLSLAGICFRDLSNGAQYSEYCAQIGQGLLTLKKTSGDSAGSQTTTTLAQQAIPGQFDPTHWYQVDLTAIGNNIVVNIDGNTLIQYTDTASPNLAGSFGLWTCCGTVDFGNIVVRAIPLGFVPVTPCRIADTRNATGPFGGPSLAGQSSRSFLIPSSACGIPSTASAYSLNVTVVPAATLGYISLWPTGQSQPLVSTLNSLDGRIKSNAAIVPAGTSGAVSVFATDTTNVILDINGYFAPVTTAGALAFYPVTPCRVADTRNATGALGGPSLVGYQTRSFPVLSSACGIPSSAQAYSLNFTAVPHGSLGYLSVWPVGQTQPLVSTLNAPTSAITANAAIVPAGTGGAVNLFVTDNTDMVIDMNGYFAPPGTGGLSFYTLPPCRILDTRQNAGQPFTGLINVGATGVCSLPTSAQSYVFNATVVPPETLGYLTLWPQWAAQPLVSTLNAIDGSLTSNMAIVPTADGSVSAYASNPTQLILDISGYFGP
jgi:hypothetical protein